MIVEQGMMSQAQDALGGMENSSYFVFHLLLLLLHFGAVGYTSDPGLTSSPLWQASFSLIPRKCACTISLFHSSTLQKQPDLQPRDAGKSDTIEIQVKAATQFITVNFSSYRLSDIM